MGKTIKLNGHDFTIVGVGLLTGMAGALALTRLM
jgi:hypothetical protein